MDRKRLHEIIDLILDCDYWGTANRASIEVDSDGNHTVHVYEDVGGRGPSIFYFCDEKELEYRSGHATFDPEFQKAEDHIKKIMRKIDGQNT